MTSLDAKAERPITPPTDLRLAVFDEEDLAVVSTHLQDAESVVSDMAYLMRDRRFVLIMDRFDWPLAAKGRFERCRTGLHFERVLKVARTGFDNRTDAPERLLAITFHKVDSPSGDVVLTFAGGVRIRLTVECLEAEMRDLGPRRSVEERPAHPTNGQAAAHRPVPSINTSA